MSRQKGIFKTGTSPLSILAVGSSGGSFLNEKLFRSGIDLMKLVDPGFVKGATLGRTHFTADQIGMAKAEASKQRLEAVFGPGSDQRVEAHVGKIEDMPSNIFDGVDLVIAGTDNRDAQAHTFDEAIKRAIPVVAIGVHAQGRGGHILWHSGEPGHVCYRCAMAARFDDDDTEEVVNLDGEPANVADVQSIDMEAQRIIQAILDRGRPTLMGRFYERMVKPNGYAVKVNHPDYEYGAMLMDALLADLPTSPKAYAQELKPYLMTGQTIWLSANADPWCSLCGTANEQKEKSHAQATLAG